MKGTPATSVTRDFHKPLWYILAVDIRCHEGMVSRRELVQDYEKKYGRQQVENILDLMVDSGLLIQRDMFFVSGVWDIFHDKEPGLVLPISEVAFA